MTPRIYCKDLNNDWIQYKNPIHIFSTNILSNVIPLLKKIESKVQTDQSHAVGFISYDASSAFDSALVTRIDSNFPLIWFGLYDNYKKLDINKHSNIKLNLESTISREAYLKNIHKIKDYIKAGDTYQVNYTYPLQSTFEYNSENLFWKLALAQPTPYSMFIETDDWAVASVSPELFFTLNGNNITTRPMKGTRKRAFTLKDDLLKKEELFYSEKDRAENLMIVDMIRNDLGRVADVETVAVEQLFRIEKYPTVWQMTSEITANTHATITEILQSLFPCASITGAPKPRTMEIIQELEQYPRKIYTGCMGKILPGKQAQFSIAIRTAVIDKISKKLEYSIGGGIVWDSNPEDEYQESLIKAKVIRSSFKEFNIIDALLWEPENGYFILPYHIERLKASAKYFDYPFIEEALYELLNNFESDSKKLSHKIRITLSAEGQFTLEAIPIESKNLPKRKTITLANSPIQKINVFLYHKTTEREIYQKHLKKNPLADDVILFNEEGEITESCSSNIVLEKDGIKFTPPIHCGLLPGTFRAKLLDDGEIKEQVIYKNELQKYNKIYLINSVRKWQEVQVL